VQGSESESTNGAASQFTRSSLKAQTGLYFWWPSTDSWCVAMVEPPVSYLDSMVPTAACEMAIVFRSVGCACCACGVLSIQASPPSSVISSAVPTAISMWTRLGRVKMQCWIVMSGERAFVFVPPRRLILTWHFSWHHDRDKYLLRELEQDSLPANSSLVRSPERSNLHRRVISVGGSLLVAERAQEDAKG
jgi:hypothetical protein